MLTDAPPEYAVKVFAGCHKDPWSNEKDIYNALASTNPNILKYFGSDVHELPSTSYSQSLLNSEFWIMTEFHPCGSLYDFLKANWLTWPQMVRILNSFLEGLTYLHSENAEMGKKFTIAHRDLKSKNILMRSDGQSCCIGDFGLALKLNNSNKLFNAEIRSKV
jgi:serine/threonine protein kinase